MDHLQHYPLKELMPKAFARPKDLAAVDELQAKGCTALVVACHCCLIRDGFVPEDRPASRAWVQPQPDYTLPPAWHRNDTEWQIRYTHPALQNAFLLEIYRNVTQVLVRFVEDTPLSDGAGPSKLNVQQIGLNLHLYVRKPEELRQNTWDEALDWDKMDNLANYWSEIMFQHMCLPAVKKLGYNAEDAWGRGLGMQDGCLILGAEPATFAAIAAGVLMAACLLTVSVMQARSRSRT